MLIHGSDRKSSGVRTSFGTGDSPSLLSYAQHHNKAHLPRVIGQAISLDCTHFLSFRDSPLPFLSLGVVPSHVVFPCVFLGPAGILPVPESLFLSPSEVFDEDYRQLGCPARLRHSRPHRRGVQPHVPHSLRPDREWETHPQAITLQSFPGKLGKSCRKGLKCRVFPRLRPFSTICATEAKTRGKPLKTGRGGCQ